MVTLYYFLWFFLFYSVIGWIVECAYHTMVHGEIVNRGFLNGPTCPIYGFGMIVVVISLTPLVDKPFILFGGGLILCTLVEFLGGMILDMIFHMRWWDYSDKKFNIHGYVCPEYSLMWGLAVVAAMKLVHPLIVALIKCVPMKAGVVLLCVAGVIYLVDVIVSVQKSIGMSKTIRELEAIASRLHDIGDTISTAVGETVVGTGKIADEAKEKLSDMSDEVNVRIANEKAEAEEKARILINRIHAYHAFKAFPAIDKSDRINKIRENLSSIFTKLDFNREDD